MKLTIAVLLACALLIAALGSILAETGARVASDHASALDAALLAAEGK